MPQFYTCIPDQDGGRRWVSFCRQVAADVISPAGGARRSRGSDLETSIKPPVSRATFQLRWKWMHFFTSMAIFSFRLEGSISHRSCSYNVASNLFDIANFNDIDIRGKNRYPSTNCKMIRHDEVLRWKCWSGVHSLSCMPFYGINQRKNAFTPTQKPIIGP